MILELAEICGLLPPHAFLPLYFTFLSSPGSTWYGAVKCTNREPHSWGDDNCNARKYKRNQSNALL